MMRYTRLLLILASTTAVSADSLEQQGLLRDAKDAKAFADIEQLGSVLSVLSSFFADNQGAKLADSGQDELEVDANVDAESDTDTNTGSLVDAVQQLASLASGIGSLLDSRNADQPPLVSVDIERPPPVGALPHEASMPAPAQRTIDPLTKRPATPKPAAKETMERKGPNGKTQGQPFAILTRLEGIQRLTKLSKKLALLTDETSPLSMFERIQHLLSDPDVSETINWVTDHAATLLTPETFSALKSFVRSSALVPGGYKEVTLLIIESLEVLFRPEILERAVRAKEVLDAFAGDGVQVLETVYRGIQWGVATFDPVYIQHVSERVTAWRRIISSPEFVEFVAFVSDPVTLERLSSVVGDIKATLTVERVHRLRSLSEEWGLFDPSDDKLKALGGDWGRIMKKHLATAEGISGLEAWLDDVDAVFGSHVLDRIAGDIGGRAASISAELEEDLRTFLEGCREVAENLPEMLVVMRECLSLAGQLLGSESPDSSRVSIQALWMNATSILQKLSSVPGISIAGIRSAFRAALTMTQPDHVEELRMLVADVLREFASSSSLSLDFQGFLKSVEKNETYCAAGSGDELWFELGYGFGFGLEDGGMDGRPSSPAGMARDVEALHVMQRLETLYGFLIPGEIERTREILHLLNSATSLLLELLNIFDSSP